MKIPEPLSHAYLITGGSEASRGEFARKMAAAYLCEGEQVPCGICRPCRKIAVNAHPDLIRYEGDLAIYRRHILPFCEGVKELGYPLEINFLGLMDSRHYPREDFFRIAAEVGNDVIFGMDAHSPGAMLRKDVLEKAHDFCNRLGLHIVENVTLRRPV